MSPRKIAFFAVVIGALLNGASAAFTKKGVTEIPPLTFAMLRLTVASLVILPFFLKQKGHALAPMREITPISLFATLNVIFFVLGMKLTSGNIGAVIYVAVPLVTTLILYFFFKEKLSKHKLLGVLLGFSGGLIITLLPLIEKGNQFSGNLLGNFLLICAITSWSFYLVYSKRLQKKYSPFMVTSNFIFVTTVVLIPFFLWDLQQHFGWWQHVTMWGIGAVFYLGIIITIGAYTLNQYAVKHGGSVFASTTFYLFPIFGFTANFFMLGEHVTTGLILGSVLALIGTSLVMRK